MWYEHLLNEAKNLFHPLIKAGGISTFLVAKLGKHTGNARTVLVKLNKGDGEAHTEFDVV